MSAFTYPPQLEITPLDHSPQATVTVPGSKSITNRALILAALTATDHGCVLNNILRSEDTEVMLRALGQLGFHIRDESAANGVRIARDLGTTPSARLIPAASADLFVENSGTSMRFLTAMVALGRGTYRLDGIARMRERPIRDLLDALGTLGVNAISVAGNGCPPVVVTADGMSGGTVRVRGDVSSQFLSGLLMAAPFARGPVEVEWVGEVVSEPYITMTVQMMAAFGLPVDSTIARRFRTDPTAKGDPPVRYAIEPDASAASYFWAAAAVCGGQVTVLGLSRQSLQGDVAFVEVLEQMGCRVEENDRGITVHGRPLRGVDVDMNAISDTVMTLAAVACFADGPTTIRNVGHIRHKETDRIAAVTVELRKLGVEVEESVDGLRITPRPITGCAVDTYNDHRMAMSLALVGLRIPGVTIRNPGCVAKTYPGFWQDLEKLRT